MSSKKVAKEIMQEYTPVGGYHSFLVDEITELDDLKTFLPEVDEIAQEKLKQDIISRGIREPLILAKYKDENILLDGHHRLEIAKSMKEKRVPVVFYKIDSLTHAKQIILDNQLAKRNLDAKQRILAVLELEPQLAEEARLRKKAIKEQKEVLEPEQSGRTIKKLAKMAGESCDKVTKIKNIKACKNARLLDITAKKDGLSIDSASKLAKKAVDEDLTVEQIDVIIEEELKKAEKPEKVKPENNRNFKIGEIQVAENRLIIDYTRFSDIVLDADNEIESIEKINGIAGYFTQLVSDLKKTARYYKTPQSPREKKIRELTPEKLQQKQAQENRKNKQADKISELLNSEYLTEAKKQDFRTSTMKYRDLVNAIKKEIELAYNEVEGVARTNRRDKKVADEKAELDALVNSEFLSAEQKASFGNIINGRPLMVQERIQLVKEMNKAIKQAQKPAKKPAQAKPIKNIGVRVPAVQSFLDKLTDLTDAEKQSLVDSTVKLSPKKQLEEIKKALAIQAELKEQSAIEQPTKQAE